MSRIFITTKAGIKIGTTTAAVAGQNVVLDLAASTISVLAEMDMQAFYSQLVDYWHATPGMSAYSFPFNALDDTSAKYQLGYDGTTYNGWAFKDITSKRNIKNAGFRIYNTNGSVAEEWFGAISTVGGIADTDQPYYILAATDAPISFAFAGPVNEPVQVFGDATHGAFDKRTFFRMFVREQGKTYAQADISDIPRTATGPYAQSFGLKNAADDNVKHPDATVNAAPYTGLAVTYNAAGLNRAMGSSSFSFNKIVDNTTALLDRYGIYERLQYLFRQAADVDGAGGAASGKTTDTIAYFVGSTLYVNGFIDGLLANDINSVVFLDKTGTAHAFPFAAAGNFLPNAVLQALAGAKYTAYFKTVGGGFGTSTAVVVNDKDGNPLTGTIAGRAQVPFTFDYDGNVQGGRGAGADALCELVVTAPGTAKYLRTEFTITRTTGLTVPLTGTADPVYVA